MELLEEIAQRVLCGKNKDVKILCRQALDEGISAEDILNKGLLAGMSEASERYRKNEILITHVLLAAGAMNVGTKVLQAKHPEIEADREETGEKNLGTVVIGTVQGDLHDIGKNLVKMMLESKGFEVVDLGVNVDPAAFIQTAIDRDARIIACSALLTTTMPMLDKVVEIAEKRGVRDQVRIMIGGAPVTPEYAERIGADAYTDNAAEAVTKALKFVEEFDT